MNNAVKEQVAALLDKKMDRSEFIKQVAFGLVAMTGVGAALRSTMQKQQAQNQAVSLGYGSAAYGGSSKPGQS